MSNTYSQWYHPYDINPKYKEKVAYFSMEIANDQALKTYSGGLGFLAGSHMKSAFAQQQNLIGVTILWTGGYYDQVRDDHQRMQVRFRHKTYTFLEDAGIEVTVPIWGQDVKVKAYVLKPEVFNTAPIYYLTTDLEENPVDYRYATFRLYDVDRTKRLMQYMILGIGGIKVVEALGGADVYHMNEAHALPMAFYRYKKYGNLETVRKKMVFTTHTPEKAGNDEFDYGQLEGMGYFSGVPAEEVKRILNMPDRLSTTPAALKMSRKANAVSQLHGEVSREMWKEVENACPIIAITNAQKADVWRDQELYQHMESGNTEGFIERKRALKRLLFEEVADQTGKLFRDDVLTIVWARRFAAYKRANLILRDLDRFWRLLYHEKHPVQIIWAGKPYPEDGPAVNLFNTIVEVTNRKTNCAILTGYELRLSKWLKGGADLWLNTPRKPREASGTSGMTAAMNGAINFTVDDGWIPEFGKDGKNAFIIQSAPAEEPDHVRDQYAYESMMSQLEQTIVPMYYNNPKQWLQIAQQGMKDVLPFFDSDRMADEYYERLFKA